MAKTAKLKKSTKSSSIHSRAAKRASSPSFDFDKSLKTLKAPIEAPKNRCSILSSHHGAGISKRKINGKSKSRHQRLRQEKGMQRAEAVMDKLEQKVEKTSRKVKVIRERGAAWEELNDKIQDKKPKPKVKGKSVADDEWKDNETDAIMGEILPAQVLEPVVDLPELTISKVLPSTEPPHGEEDVIL